MSGWTPLILVELVLVFGGVLAWGLWELHVLRREKRGDERRDDGGDGNPR